MTISSTHYDGKLEGCECLEAWIPIMVNGELRNLPIGVLAIGSQGSWTVFISKP